jgi:hypothetical protein
MSTPLGLAAGLKAGIHLGPGDLFLNVRYSGDLGILNIPGELPEDPGIAFQRSSLHFGVGYEFGLFDRKR